MVTMNQSLRHSNCCMQGLLTDKVDRNASYAAQLADTYGWDFKSSSFRSFVTRPTARTQYSDRYLFQIHSLQEGEYKYWKCRDKLLNTNNLNSLSLPSLECQAGWFSRSITSCQPSQESQLSGTQEVARVHEQSARILLPLTTNSSPT